MEKGQPERNPKTERPLESRVDHCEGTPLRQLVAPIHPFEHSTAICYPRTPRSDRCGGSGRLLEASSRGESARETMDRPPAETLLWWILGRPAAPAIMEVRPWKRRNPVADPITEG